MACCIPETCGRISAGALMRSVCWGAVIENVQGADHHEHRNQGPAGDVTPPAELRKAEQNHGSLVNAAVRSDQPTCRCSLATMTQQLFRFREERIEEG